MISLKGPLNFIHNVELTIGYCLYKLEGLMLSEKTTES